MELTNKRLLNLFLILCVLAHLVAVFYSVGFHHYDEHYQVLEFASYKLGKTPLEDLAWEYSARIRPTLQPFIAFFSVKALNYVGVEDPFYHGVFFRFISFIFSVYCVMLLIKLFSPGLKTRMVYVTFIFLSLLTWYLPYLHVRFCAEVWAMNFFILGFVRVYEKDKNVSLLDCVLVGLFLAISFVMKFQSGVLSGGLILWLIFIKKISFKSLSIIILSGLVFYLLFGVYTDFLFYGEWVVAPYNYFTVNIVEGKTSEFGTSGVWFYVHKVYHRSFVPIGFATLASCLYLPLRKPKNPLAWIVLPYIAIHFMIGHKELRFLFPVVCFIPVMIAMGLEDLIKVVPNIGFRKRFIKPMVIVLLVSHLVLVPLGALKPAFSAASVFDYVNDKYKDEVTINYYNCFSCLNWYFYTSPKVSYNQLRFNYHVRPYFLDFVKGNQVFVTAERLTEKELSASTLKLDYQTGPDWLDTEFAKRRLKLGPVWYVYVPK